MGKVDIGLPMFARKKFLTKKSDAESVIKIISRPKYRPSQSIGGVDTLRVMVMLLDDKIGGQACALNILFTTTQPTLTIPITNIPPNKIKLNICRYVFNYQVKPKTGQEKVNIREQCLM